MKTPLLGTDQLVADESDGRIVLTGMVAGPAGSNSFEVGAIAVDVDAASPAILNRVELLLPRQPSADLIDLLTMLFGSRRTEELLEFSSRPVRRLVLEGTPTSNQSQRSRGVNPRVAALATALSTMDRPGLLVDEEALLLLEAATIAQELRLLPHMGELTEQARAAASALVEHGPAFSTQFDATARAHTTRLLLGAASVLNGSAVADLETLAGQIEAAEEGHPASRGQRPRGLPVSCTPDSLPLLCGDEQPMLQHIGNDEFEIRLPSWAARIDDWWVRVYQGSSDTPLAVVPLMPEGGDAVASFLLDPAFLDAVEVDIVDDVFGPPSSAQLAAFRAALASGRRAARLERLGELGRAKRQWQRSSALHRDAGDEDRARAAQSIADRELAMSRGFRRTKVQPIVTDVTGPIA